MTSELKSEFKKVVTSLKPELKKLWRHIWLKPELKWFPSRSRNPSYSSQARLPFRDVLKSPPDDVIKNLHLTFFRRKMLVFWKIKMSRHTGVDGGPRQCQQMTHEGRGMSEIGQNSLTYYWNGHLHSSKHKTGGQKTWVKKVQKSII